MAYTSRFVVVLSLMTATLAAQSPGRELADAKDRRVTERVRALQGEAKRLAGQAGTLVGELRKLEIERDLRVEEAKQAETAMVDAQRSLQAMTERIVALDQERRAQLPNLEAQLVDVYKRGRAGYARILFGADDLRELARTTRAVAALTTINERRVTEHRRTLEAVRQERAALEQKARDLQAHEAMARDARAAGERAVTARASLIAQIDARRDMTAQYLGELQVASDLLQQQVASLIAGRPADAIAVPLVPFRGALDWPVVGRISSRFSQASGRPDGSAVKNGIEIMAPEGTPVRAIHGGTIGYAEAFTGFGTLVIIDHGASNYSLYGYLGAVDVQRGHTVESGAELGRVGFAPGGPSALYFEVRIDGRSVDPLQWLTPR